MSRNPLIVLVAAATLASCSASYGDHKHAATQRTMRVCVYTGGSIARLSEFDRLIGRKLDCAQVFNTDAPDWRAWTRPWFVNYKNIPDYNWSRWATARGRHRMLVITQGLIPASERLIDWRSAGAAGQYVPYAREFALRLVAAGLGSAVIRLAPEANYPPQFDSIGSTPQQVQQWRTFWRLTVKTMRAVRGAHFTFNWCVNAAVQPVPLESFYPGDDVVDSIGVDAYDAGVAPGNARWSTIYGRADGVQQVAAFAHSHRKRFAVPEWGIGPVGQYLAGGDDPAYVNGIAWTVRTQHAAFQSYFFTGVWASQLQNSPLSLAAYRRAFG